MCLRCLPLAAAVLMLTAKPGSSEVPLNGLTPAEEKAGWQLLFDGSTTNQWRGYKSESFPRGWKIVDGAITRLGNGAGDIITKQKYESFELSLEYRISAGGNSGIMFHVTEDNLFSFMSGPEIQILDNASGHDRQQSGWLYQLYKPQKPAWAVKFEKQAGFSTPEIDDATRPAGEWNHIYLRVWPNDGEVCLNGVSYYRFQKGSPDWEERVAASKFAKMPRFGKANTGHICLQDHGNEVAFRNIKIRLPESRNEVTMPIDGELPLKPVEAFPGIEWEGWQPVDDSGKVRARRSMVVTHAGDGSGRVFVASQRGLIHVINKNTPTKAELFLDLTARVRDYEMNNEEGLLGLAFHPDFATNGEFFVYYSPTASQWSSYVSRFSVSSDPNKADPNSEQVVIDMRQPFTNHNGGSIAFGPDGFLYIGLGDGGGRNDPKHLAQDLSDWMGSILRIDVDSRSTDSQYGIPAGNPFVHRAGAKPEIYAYGLRNVWRLAFDRETGQLWAADVGQDLWEEINLIRNGGNYGWSLREAPHVFSGQMDEPQDQPIDPIWEYDHRIGKSITGGFVYRGSDLPELRGRYVYADYVAGRMFALKYNSDSSRIESNMSIPWNGLPVASFGEDEAGELYITTPTTAPDRGIYRLEQR